MPRVKNLSEKRKRRRDSSSSSSSTSSSSTDSTDTCSDDSSVKLSNTKSVKRKLKRLKRLEKYVSDMKCASVSVNDEKVIPPFDPRDDSQSVEKWVERVDELAKYYNWSETTVGKLVAGRLQGLARKWYDSQDELNPKWGKMKTLLINQFKKPVPFGMLLREASSYEAKPGQNLSEYCFYKLSKLKALKVNIPEEYLVDAVIFGIKNENIVRAARSSHFTTTNELYSYLSTIGSTPSTSKHELKRPFQHSNNFAHPVSSDKNPTHSTNKRITCFNCQGNHFLKNCPKPKIECLKCKKFGHKQDKCPSKL